jgi:CysZ protein
MLTDTIVQRSFFISLGVAVLLLVAMFPTTTVLVEAAGTTGYPWLDRLLEVLSLAGTAVLAWFLFPTVVAAVLLDKVVAATERRHFPGLPAAEDQPVLKTLPYALGFAALVLVLNLLALPLYLVPGLNIPVYLALNGYLLGREYVELVLARRHSLAALKPLRRQYRRQIWGTGLVTAVLLLIPFLNLLAPVLGGALAALRVHRATARNLQR